MTTGTLPRSADVAADAHVVMVCPACRVTAVITARYGTLVAVYHLCPAAKEGNLRLHPVRMEQPEPASEPPSAAERARK
jgi:hypothetical protein